MARIRRQNLPPRLLDHLLDRVDARNISAVHIGSLADWLRTVIVDGASTDGTSGSIVERTRSRGLRRDEQGAGMCHRGYHRDFERG